MKKCFDRTSFERIIHAFVSSKLDYGNSLLKGIPDYLLQKLQYVQNSAARLLTGLRKYDHISPTLMDLHWLPVAARIDYKVALITFKCLNGMGPSYLSDLLVPLSEDRRSADGMLLVIPKTNKVNYGDRSFRKAAAKLWNELPVNLRCCNSLEAFKRGLKAYLYRRSYE